ncbi:thiamine pyrophosphate-dependent enzyme [Salinicola acroporae]|uniref:Thiamine pyrophosphate-binding protein n=1 Tax=Salinicola acroporae TaxID=1541440 RepID=A0ABT6I8M9_9GAMM|nr:thiamine pyrophosphate-dependent enzyme [Salinicola acroporae]MDH4573971.1 thiamine pyrophosphate-binding protein [Salinicola acroporae]
MTENARQTSPRPRTGGEVLVDQLLIHGTDHAYCVPGESYLAVLDALYAVRDRFQLYNARHEAGAANMAEASGKLTGEPGVAFVTRGPGACHAAIGVHIAMQDSTPMILFIGQVAREALDREAFQEIDYTAMFGGVAKWVAQIEDARRIPEYLSRAYRTATSGRPGPVVIALPEDMLTDTVTVADAPRYRATAPQLSSADVEQVMTALESAARPLVLLGGSGWDDEACHRIARFAEANYLPVACAFRRQDLIDNRSPAYVGDFGTAVSPTLTVRLAEADLLLVINSRLGELTTRGYTTVAIPNPAQRLIHLHLDADEIGRVYAPEIGLAASPKAFASAVATRQLSHRDRWRAWQQTLRGEHLADRQPLPGDQAMVLSRALVAAAEILPDKTIVTLDAGNHAGWVQRFLCYARPGRQLGSTCGAMGYAVPAAVAASLAAPDQRVIACVGDGGFMMSGQELATAIQHGGHVIVLLFNNASYATIRMHQEREYPTRVVGTDLHNPDFVALAKAMGASSERISDTDAFVPALQRALAHAGCSVIEITTDIEAISSRTTLSELRRSADGNAS